MFWRISLSLIRKSFCIDEQHWLTFVGVVLLLLLRLRGAFMCPVSAPLNPNIQLSAFG